MHRYYRNYTRTRQLYCFPFIYPPNPIQTYKHTKFIHYSFFCIHPNRKYFYFTFLWCFSFTHVSLSPSLSTLLHAAIVIVMGMFNVAVLCWLYCFCCSYKNVKCTSAFLLSTTTLYTIEWKPLLGNNNFTAIWTAHVNHYHCILHVS